ncbi:hypothetical protein BVG16_21445 [Paenibacillus selenitireducens]|uniref:Uncharacterized protein n=1 Tax=Paenibacillus selenitireducens TaxID=1324314 RepID=A0A1T2X6F6_9BACL|nr:hypothetical protein [Paenibacillus selenitireducens]OPA75173.1 hypothetical protein BVG16_21445 [Paenibacillus selenitireducens]
MELFEEIFHKQVDEEPAINSNKQEMIRPKIDRINAGDFDNNKELSPLCQFFIAQFISTDMNGVLYLPIVEEKYYRQIIEEIAPCFDMIRKVTKGNEVQIMLQTIKDNAKNKFLNLKVNNNLNPIVYDLYNKETNEKSYSKIKRFNVTLDQISITNEYDIEGIWDFIYNTFMELNDCVILMPNEWSFDSSFKDHIAVRAFASVCKSMQVTVDCDNNKIVAIILT